MQNKTKYSQISIWTHGPLWVFFVYLYIQILALSPNETGNPFLYVMYFIQFGIHEASHIVFGFLPPLFAAAAGSIGEIGFTILLAVVAFRSKSYFFGVFSLLWVMLAMTSVGIYMADARAQQLLLIGPGPDPQHDWHFIFSQLNLLSSDILIGNSIRLIGSVVGGTGLIVGLILLVRMVANSVNKS